MIRIAIAGTGRMGQAIAAAAAGQRDLTLCGHWGRGDDLDALLATADVLVDFTLGEATGTVADAVIAAGKPLVCGVSGLDGAALEALDRAASVVPVVYDRNMSLGVAVLERAVRDAAAVLGEAFAVEIAEVHHIHKKDAPSGTALKLGEAVAAARGRPDSGFIRFHAERRGEVPGDHEVIFASPTERLTFAHSVTTRQVFADGALTAARWVIGRPAGRYAMRDVLLP